MPNLAMRLPATQFSADGLDLAWPLGGEREVVAVDEDKLTLRIKRRIAEGQIQIVDDKPTKEIDNQAREYRLLTGEEARKHMAEPAGPVTRVVYHPATPEDEKDYQLEVQTFEGDSDRFKEAQAAKEAAAEEAHAAISDAQIAAEKAAAKDAKEKAKAEAPDPLADRLQRTQEASAEYIAAREKEAAEREKIRQELEADELKHFDKRAKAHSEGAVGIGGNVVLVEPDTSAEDEALAEREKIRVKEEARVEKERQAEAKAAAEASKDAPTAAWAGKTSPFVAPPSGGVRAGAGTTLTDRGASAPAPVRKATRSTAKKSKSQASAKKDS